MFSLICAWINDWVNNNGSGDLRRHRAHYDVSVMKYVQSGCINANIPCDSVWNMKCDLNVSKSHYRIRNLCNYITNILFRVWWFQYQPDFTNRQRIKTVSPFEWQHFHHVSKTPQGLLVLDIIKLGLGLIYSRVILSWPFYHLHSLFIA